MLCKVGPHDLNVRNLHRSLENTTRKMSNTGNSTRVDFPSNGQSSISPPPPHRSAIIIQLLRLRQGLITMARTHYLYFHIRHIEAYPTPAPIISGKYLVKKIGELSSTGAGRRCCIFAMTTNPSSSFFHAGLALQGLVFMAGCPSLCMPRVLFKRIPTSVIASDWVDMASACLSR